MDPITLGIIVSVAASGAAAAFRLRRRGLEATAGEKPAAARARPSEPSSTITVGDVLTYLGEEYWLAGELALERDAAIAWRVFRAPERTRDRWVAVPRDERFVWLLEEDAELKSLGWPGVDAPLSGRILRRFENANVAIAVSGEGLAEFAAKGRLAMLRAHDAVALVLESSGRILALVGREIPRQLVDRMG